VNAEIVVRARPSAEGSSGGPRIEASSGVPVVSHARAVRCVDDGILGSSRHQLIYISLMS
jgi:hypothetical protein